MDTAEALRALTALADQNRLETFRCLVRHGPLGIRTADLAARVRAEPAALDYHLAVLEEAGLVVSWSRRAFYAANSEALRRLVDFLIDDRDHQRPAPDGAPGPATRPQGKVVTLNTTER